MKKHLLVLLFLVVSGFYAKAQTSSAAPDGYGYTWKNNLDASGPAFNWIDISTWPGTTFVTGLADDNIVGPFPLTAAFHFYWYDPVNFYVGSNGYLEFDKSTTVASPFPTIPNSGGIQDYLGAMTSDLTFTDDLGEVVSGAKCMYWQNADSMIITWDSVPFWNSVSPGWAGTNSFQIVLNNLDSTITYNYLNQSGASFAATQFMTIGIESKAGSIGLPYEQGGLISDFYPIPSSSVRFYPPAVDTAAINDVATAFVGNPTTGGLILSKNGAPYTSIAEGINSGNMPQGTFDFYSRVVVGSNTIQVRDTVLFPATTPGQTQTVTFPDTWTPTTAGTYRHIVETRLGATDLVPSNNIRTLEIQVVDTTVTPILLSFDNGVDDGTGGLGWAGGGGGGAIYYVPPFTPCTITALRAFITGNTNGVGFSMHLFDDDGPNGTALTQLDSVNVDAANVQIGVWNMVTLPTPVTIPSGGFYLAWMMGGDGIALGQNALSNLVPVSNRTYEILGPVTSPSSWSQWRSREIQDMMLNAYIDGVVGINDNSKLSALFGNVYPNPATDKVYLAYDLSSFGNSKMLIEVYDIKGQLVSSNNVTSEKGTLEIKVSGFAAGTYICKISVGTNQIQRQINVIKK
ncbi:MAG: T9SS type A sorting domain-containing protein [Bacteroidota bacterium]